MQTPLDRLYHWASTNREISGRNPRSQVSVPFSESLSFLVPQEIPISPPIPALLWQPLCKHIMAGSKNGDFKPTDLKISIHSHHTPFNNMPNKSKGVEMQ